MVTSKKHLQVMQLSVSPSDRPFSYLYYNILLKFSQVLAYSCKITKISGLLN
jgi:hypothetical protein